MKIKGNQRLLTYLLLSAALLMVIIGVMVMSQTFAYYNELSLARQDGLLEETVRTVDESMTMLMTDLRENPPVEIAGVAVLEQKDYKDGSVVCVATGEKTTMELTDSNVLRYEMADGTSLIVRPSGTEPKVKVYILTSGETQADCDAKVAKYAAWADTLKG